MVRCARTAARGVAGLLEAQRGASRMNNMEMTTALVTSPSAAFADLKEKPKFWFPLLAVLLSTVAVLVWYYNFVDFDWLIDRMMSADTRTQQMPEDQRAQAMAMMKPGFIMWSSVISVLVFVTAARALEALYFSLAGNITNVRHSYKQWFALSCWTALPHLIGALGMVAFLLTSSTNQISNEELQLLSLNELIFHVPLGGKGYVLLSSLTILHPWAWWLTVVGVRVWTQRSWLFSTVFALLPSIVVYGVWALIAFS
jgi:hypothetical protein